MKIYQISEKEQQQLDDLTNNVSLAYSAADAEEFLQHAYIWAGELPFGIKEELFNLKNDPENSGVTIFRGYKRDIEPPLTPKSWDIQDTYLPDHKADYLSVVLASLIGEPFGFETQQGGKLIHDVVPIEGMEI